MGVERPVLGVCQAKPCGASCKGGFLGLVRLGEETVFGKGATFLDFVTINTVRVLFEVLLVGEGEVRRKQVLIFYTNFLLFIFLFVFHYWQFG